MQLLSRGKEGSKEFTFVEQNVASAGGERKRRFIDVYIALRRRPRRSKRSSSLPVPRSRESRVRPRRPPVFRSGSGMPEAGWDARLGTPILGTRTDADELPFGLSPLGCYCYAAAEPSGRASQAAGGRLHGATWPRDDRQTLVSVFSAAQPERLDCLDSGVFVSITTISSSGLENCSFKLALLKPPAFF